MVCAQRHEFQLIDSIKQQVTKHPRVSLGIGDDTASLRFPQPAECLVTVDMLTEGVHFTIPPASPEQVGRKALGVNLSDIAAMAGKPLAAVVGLALPRGRGWGLAQGIHAGMQALADRFQVAIVGGDTNSWDGPLVISVTLLGEAIGTGPVLRRGAKPGDWIMVTGELGGSLSGGHLDFQPRVAEALTLHERVSLHAMIDISDGLAVDLEHICTQSSVGAVLYETAIPISEAARSAEDGRSPLQHALGDGEDFELLWTVSPGDGQRLLDQQPFEVALTHVGEIVSGSGLKLREADGRTKPLDVTGWQHWL